MEYYSTNEFGFLEEFYTNYQDLSAINGGWDLDYNNILTTNDSSFDHSLLSYAPFGDESSPPHFPLHSSTLNLDTQTFPYEYGAHNLDTGAPCKTEPVSELPSTFNMGFCPLTERKNKVKKMNGQPSKNLMAERRRRKRLNDRLSLLRSVVPKISKMDRASILGNTINYMKELLNRINNLQQEMHLGSNPMSIFKDVKPNEMLVRNSPKFEVERRNEDTRVEIWCGGKAGMLVSTVTTLEALGLEIQHCVISCFNDFALQASCSQCQDFKKGSTLDSEDIKQALVRNAGYGGSTCL